MKVCPLITQVSLLEEEKELLVREPDDGDLSGDESSPAWEEDGEDIFINPGAGEGADDEETAGDDREEPDVREVRFAARSFRGEVKCLGESCRFYDEESGNCRFESLLGLAGDEGSAAGEAIEEFRSDIERSWEFQKQSVGDIIGMFRELEEKSSSRVEELERSFEKKMDELRELISSVNEDNKAIIESISDTLAEKTEEIESRLDGNERGMEEFRGEVTGWRGSLDNSMERLEEGLEENGRLAREVAENNSEIMKVVENQKRTLEEEERRRRVSEAKKLNNAGVIAYHNGAYEKALELFGRAVEMDGEFTEGYNNLGLTYTEMNDEDKATEAFKKAIELNPDLAATYNNLGYVFYRLGSYNEAIEMYNEAIGRSGDSSSAYTNLGNAWYKLDKVEEAIEAWKKAIELDPSNEKARRNLKRFHAETR